MQSNNMMAKGHKAPGTFPDPLGPILIDRGGPRAAPGPKDAKPNTLALFDEVNERMDIKSELKMTKGRSTTTTTTTTTTKATTVQLQQLSSATAAHHQGWREDNETAYPFYQNDNRLTQWPSKVTAEGHYVTLPPPPLPLDPLSPPFPAVAAVGVGVGEVSGRRGSSFGGISVIRTTADVVCSRSAGAKTSAGAGPGGPVRPPSHRQRGHRGGRQREKTPTFMSEEEKLNWEKERRKKDIHNKVEQRRRYNINDRIQDLGNILINGGLEVRQSKGAILRETIHYIRTLHSEKVRLGQFENLSGKLELENNKLFSKIQRIEMLLQAHGYQTTTTTTGQQLYATEDNNHHQLHHNDLASPTIASSYFPALKEETISSEQYQQQQQRYHSY